MTKGMKSLAFLLAAGLLCGAAPLASAETKRATVMNAFDLDGLAADADRLITAALGVIVSETDYTGDIVAQPDSCRLHDITISDTDMGVGEGAITVVGTDCFGYTRTCSWSAWTAGDDDGVKTLVCTNGKGAYFKTVTSVTTGVMTAAATDEYFLLGYTTGPAFGYGMYGKELSKGPDGENRVDLFGEYPLTTRITTSGVASTTVTGTGAFTNVVVGDLLLFLIDGTPYERRVTARASANSITVNSAVNIPVSGVPFSYKHWYFSTDPADELWVRVRDWKNAGFEWSIDANADTDGITVSLTCVDAVGPDGVGSTWVEVGPGAVNGSTVNIASGSTQVPYVKAVALEYASFAYCRFGLKFGTGDDADVANEDINLSVMLSK